MQSESLNLLNVLIGSIVNFLKKISFPFFSGLDVLDSVQRKVTDLGMVIIVYSAATFFITWILNKKRMRLSPSSKICS